MLLRSLCRYGIATWLGALHAGCGVYMGEPIRLFPEKHRDGGIPTSEACELDRTLVSGNIETTVGATGAELLELSLASYSADLAWTQGGRTTVRVNLSNVSVYSVDATRNPAYDRWSETPVCRDHATIEAALDLKTDDGRLNEHIEKIQLFAYDDYEAYGSVEIEKAALVGSYVSVARPGQCFLRLSVRLLLARDGLHGSLGDDVEQGACDDGVELPVNELASAHWGKRWTNYGD